MDKLAMKILEWLWKLRPCQASMKVIQDKKDLIEKSVKEDGAEV